MTTKSKRNKALYGTVGMTPVVAMMVSAQPAYGAILSNASNTVSICSGIKLPQSDITNAVVPLLQNVVTPVENLTNGLLSGVGSLLGLQPVHTNVSSILQQLGSGTPISVEAVTTGGTILGASDACYASANGVTLTSPAGISIGGNAVTGLGDATRPIAVAGEFGSIALGNNAQTDATATGSIAIGSDSKVAAGASNAVALGNGATASVANSVALGAGSMTTRAARGSYSGYLVGAGQAAVGEVSVGTASGRRQITNVAAGDADTDAVNVAQLKVLGNQVGGLDTRIANNATAITNVNTRVDVTNNALATTDGRVTTLQNNVANGNIGVWRYSDGNGTPTGGSVTNNVTVVGGAPGTVTLHNVGAGAVNATSTDAVNGAQLAGLQQTVTTNNTTLTNQFNTLDGRVTSVDGRVTNVDNRVTQVDNRISAVGDSVTTVDNRVTQVDGRVTALDALAVKYDAGSNGARITLGGGAGGTKITNLAAGDVSATSTDAVTGAQLDTTNRNFASSITNVTNTVNAVDARVTANADAISATNVTVGGIDNRVTQNTTDIGGLDTRLTNLDGLAVKYDAGSNGARITLGGGAGGTRITNLAAGEVSATSTDAVTGAQLDTTNRNFASSVTNISNTVNAVDARVTSNTNAITDIDNRVTQNTTDIGGLDTRLTDLDGLAVKYDAGSNGARITLGGGAGGTVLTNVRGGDVSETSSDAVNGSQLYAVQQSVTDATSDLGTRITNVDNRVTTVDNRVTTVANNFGDFSSLVENGGVGPVQFSNGGIAANGGTPTQDLTLVGADTGAAVHLHNVEDGQITAGSKDAVNGGQIFALQNNLGALSGLALTYDDSTKTVATLGGAGSSVAVSLRNVGAGRLSATSTDAVNGAQLFEMGQSIGDTVTNIDNRVTSNTTAITDVDGRVTNLDNRVTQNFATVDGRITQNTTDISAIDARVTTNTTAITDLGDRSALLENGGAGPLQFTNGGTTPNGGTPTQDLALIGADPAQPVRLHNVADGVVAHGSTDAVNGGQLFDSIAQGVSDLAVVYDDGAHSRITLGGTGAPAVLLSNVAEGALTATSTDAVNGAQLFATNQNVTSVTNNLATLGDTVTSIDNRVTTVANSFGDFSSQVANGGIGPIQYADADRPTVSNGGAPSQDLTLIGAGTGAVRLHNVAAGLLGAGSTDAVNGAQLAGLGTAFASRLGGFSYDPATNSLSGGFTYGGNSYADVQSVLGAIHADQTSGTGTDSKYFHANSVMEDSSASGENSTAIGPSSVSSGDNSVAMGANATADTDHAVAIGSDATATGGRAVSIGQGNTASGNGAVAIGDPSIATGDGAVVLGKDDIATGVGAIALGNTSSAIGDGAAAIGNLNNANGEGAVAIGTTNSASGLGSIALGSNNQVSGDGSLAIGSNITSVATDTLAIGTSANATAESAVAMGNRSAASDVQAVAVGTDAAATGAYSSAFGARSLADGEYTLAVGQMSTASNLGAVAIGLQATSSGYTSTALGSGSRADQDGSVALGAATATVRGAVSGYTAFAVAGPQSSAGEIAIARNISYADPNTGLNTATGNRQITGLAAGFADTDAVNVAQLKGVSASLGTTLASSLGGGASYDATTGQITGPSYTLGGVSFASVGDALEALARSTGTGGTDGTPVTATDPNAVAYDNATKGSVTLAGGGTVIHNVADGTVAQGSTDAVNGGQLATLQNQVQNGAVGAVRYSTAASPTTANGGTVTNDVTLVGANSSAPVAMHNVAEGTVAAGSTDAVNGSQLAATNARISTVENTATTAMAMGQNSAQYDSAARTSMTLGNGSDAVGLHNVADGTSAHDAVNLGQLNTATASAVEQSATYTNQQVKALSFDLSKVRKDASAGVAGAMALAGMPQPTEAGRGMVSMGMGVFQGQQAIALGIAKALTDEHTVVKLGATYNTRSQVGLNLGVGYQF